MGLSNNMPLRNPKSTLSISTTLDKDVSLRNGKNTFRLKPHLWGECLCFSTFCYETASSTAPMGFVLRLSYFVVFLWAVW